MKHQEPEAIRVFLGMPGYGSLTMGASRGLWRSSRGTAGGRPLALTIEHSSSSLLAHGFNRLWCAALNMCLRGDSVSYFAMLHSDISPEDFWLDKLIEELEAKQLDVLSAVVPIKSGHGLTSTALDNGTGDTWNPLCGLTMQEVHELPETFTSEDVGHPLLLNTGCWVCRFDMEWATQVRFQINDRIVFDKSTGQYVSQVEPEDWYFSRLCNEMGLRIGATRKVSLGHGGSMDFTNDRPWGQWSHDERYVRESVLADKPNLAAVSAA